MKKNICLILWFAAIGGSVGTVFGSQLFRLTLKAPNETLTPGSELRLLVTVTNTSERKIGFIRSPGPVPDEGFRYEIEVKDSNGRPALPSTYVRKLTKKNTVTSGSNVARWLKPGESFVDEIVITKLYDLSEPGKYTISVARSIPPRQDLGEGSIRSNLVTVTVIVASKAQPAN